MFAVLHFPQFALQAALRPAPELWARPIALVDPLLTTPRVCDRTEPARRAGVDLGLTPTQALARCRDVVIRHRSASQETAATDAILQCAYGFSPHLESTASGVVTLDLRGLSELSTGASPSPEFVPTRGVEVTPAVERWAARLQLALASLQLLARMGLGPTPNIARHAAQWGGINGRQPAPTPAELFAVNTPPPTAQAASSKNNGFPPTAHLRPWGPPCIVTDARAFIATLPVSALNPSTDVTSILQKWGVRTVGELLALGQDAVMDRLGLEAIALFAAASAQTMRPLHLVRPADRYEESFAFEQEIETAEPLLFILNRFVDQISQRLELSSLAAERLTLRLQLASGGRLEFFLQVPQPTRRADILFRMLQTHLEAIRTDSPITGVALQADPSRPSQKQFSLFEAALRDPHQFQETLARLSALVGAERVGTPVRENSHRPDAFKLIPPDFENAPTILRRRVAEILRPTPLRRLRPAMAASVERRDSAVVLSATAPHPDPASPRFSSAELAIGSVRCPSMPGVQGRVTFARGPWRASGHWWESGSNENNLPGTDASGKTGPAWQREEWDVQVQDGPALRLVQRQDRWEVEALLD